MCISETWLDSNCKSDDLQIDDYIFIRNDRGLRHSHSRKREFVQGGGTAVYLHTALNYKLLFASSIHHISETEFMILDVFSRKSADTSRFLLAVIYRRPAGLMLSEFFIKLETYMQTFKNIVIVGDFNINMLQMSFESAHLSTLAQERALEFIPFGATHYGHGQPSSIDLAIVDSLTKVKTFFVSEYPIAAGHHAITFDYKVKIPKFEPRKVTYREFKRCDVNKLSTEIEQNLSNLMNIHDNSCDVSGIVDIFNAEIISCLDRHAPLVTRTIVKPFAAWLTTALKWHVLEQEGLTSKKAELATKYFAAADLNHQFCSVAWSYLPCSTARLELIIAEVPSLVTSQFSFSPVSQTEVSAAFNELSNKSCVQSPDRLQSNH